ncbi:MAG TPA: MFS transporter [Solirubrobacteraceae bacterium]
MSSDIRSETRTERRRGRGRRRSRSAGPPIDPAAWRRLAACTAAAIVLQIDGTLITVALPRAGHALAIGAHAQGLVLGIYFLAYALTLWPGGRLVDAVGSRNVAVVGLTIFGLGALLGALAGSAGVLVASRVIQGAGAGLVSPAALAGAVAGFPPERRGTALGIWGAGSGMANLAGPLLGGALTVLLGWRANWWALVPLATISAIWIWRLTPPGLAVHGTANAPDSTANAPDSTADGAGDAGRRQRLVRSPVIAAATLVAALTFAVMIGTFFIAEQYLQNAVGYSPLGAAAALILVALLVGLAAPLAGKLADARGERLPVAIGFGCAGAALAVLGIPGVPLHGLVSLPLLLPVGVGLGLLFAPTSRAALNAVPGASHGRVSALLSAGRLIGAGIGAAVAGVALDGGITAAHVHDALLGAAGLCLLVGMPAASRLVASHSAGAATGGSADDPANPARLPRSAATS